MILPSLAPKALEAIINSLVLNERVSLLISRAVPVQPVRPMIITIRARLGPKMKTMNTNNRKKGKVIIISVNLIRILSVLPPK